MSNTRVNSQLSLALFFALGACGDGAASDMTELGSCAASLRAEQGISTQGMSHQGLSFQGISPQGIGVQGMGTQGMHVQGTRMQGLRLQGIASQGMHMQGLQAQGIHVQGLNVQGLSPQGTSSHGANAQGAHLAQGSLLDTALGADPLQLELLDGELVAAVSEGGALRGTDLIGLRLPFVTTESQTLWLQIARAERASEQPDLWLYALQLDGQDVCDGDGLGAFVPGIWDESGRHVATLETPRGAIDATFSCRAGVIAKCVFWGYAPWSVGAELHQTCTRMARADYCGNGIAHTENGTLIDMFDSYEIQTTVNSPDLSFEAGWGPDGATCVSEPRYLDVAPGGELELPSCWDAKPRCETWEKANELGAVLGNDSAHTIRRPSCGNAASDAD